LKIEIVFNYTDIVNKETIVENRNVSGDITLAKNNWISMNITVCSA